MQTLVESFGPNQNKSTPAGKSNAPVFVLGCPRSGTTVLYHMLLSAGGFAVYRTESNVFNLLAPRFGGMHTANDRKRLMNHWLRSILFKDLESTPAKSEPGSWPSAAMREISSAW